MSWLARSIANSLRIDDDDAPSPSHAPPQLTSPDKTVDDIDTDGGDLRGVKEDLTVLRESLTRQLWGVANFLAPPSSIDRGVDSELTRPESTSIADEFDHDDGEDDDDDMNCRKLGLRHDVSTKNCRLRTVNEEDDYLGENGGGGDDDWMREVAGLTEEVLTFAGNIAHHPETWLDFPVEDDEDLDDFPMSEAQKRHTLAVEHLTPRLAALRIELCPAHMSVGFFWKVYFVLLHSRLNKQDAELLSTPEIVEARAEWMQELQKRAKKESDQYHGGRFGSADFDEDFTPRSLQNDHSETHSSWTFASEPATSSTTADSDTEKQAVSTDMQYTEKSIIDEKPYMDINYKTNCAPSVSKRPTFQYVDDDDDDDDWPEDDCLVENGKIFTVGIDEDISFSDLEDDDCCIPVISKPNFQV
ncbi:hypothetical protein RND81_03G038000 [Saponaria officinalis]|uniref:BSD domain-containing protein n=1 Tax=Saponaria officinalis TaxID=3572 RepID=A0AAW1M320_SAPOF